MARVAVLGAALLVSALAALALAAGRADAADPLSIDAAVGRGATQLEGVQLPDGGFGARLPVRDSATAGEALRLARPASPAITRLDAFLTPVDAADVDNLARLTLGSPSAGDASKLLAQQNDDGGFGLSNEYQSDPLDTALGLRALTALGERDAARRAGDRLLKFATAGAWGSDGGELLLTSEALLALNGYVRRYGSTSAIDTVLAGAIAWVGDAQQADGGWSPGTLSVRNTSLALAALASSPTGTSRVSSGADALLAAQLPDGSWGDPFTTALAIRALYRAGEAIERDRVAQLPDPSVRARDLAANPTTVDSGSPVTITAKVTNVGVATASGVTAEFFIEDPASGAEPVATAAVPDLAPAAQASVDGTFDMSSAHPRTRVYVVLRAPVGRDRDLANNSSFVNVFVRIPRNTYARTRDWPRAGRDIQHSGATPNRLHPGIDPTPAWQAPADGAQTAAEGKVFYGQAGRLMAVDAKTGAFAWDKQGALYTDDRYRPPIYNKGYVFMTNPGNAGAFVAKTGEYQFYGIGGWGGSVPIFAADVIPQERGHDPVFIYLAGYEWINRDGRRCYLQPPYKDPSGSPWNDAMWPPTPTVGTEAGIGNIILSHPCDPEPLAFSSDGPRAYFSSWGYLTSFDPQTGNGPNGERFTPFFDKKLPGMARSMKAPLIDSLGQVVTAGWDGSPAPITNPAQPSLTGKGRVVASDPVDGSTNWTFTTDTRLDGSPVEYKGTIVVVDRSGRVYALDQTTGELKWSWRPDGYVPPPADQQGKSGQTLALSRRYLYVPHPDGHIYTLDARDGTELAATMFSGRPYDLAINDTDNAIYVRTLDGKLGAYPTRELPTQCASDNPNLPPAAGDIDRVSYNPDGSQLASNAAIDRPALSGDGRYVAYTREVPFPYNTELQVRDTQTGATTALPFVDQVTPDLQRWWKHSPQLSTDGRYLGFAAYLRNFRTGAEGGAIYVLDRQTGSMDPVLKNADGSAQWANVWFDGMYAKATDRDNPAFSMSADGQTIAFATSVNGIVPGDNDNLSDVFVVDRATGQRRLISLSSTGQNIPAQSLNVSLSGDGRYVAFTSTANLTGTQPETGNYDGQGPYVYRYDLGTGQLTPASVNSMGRLVPGVSPSISGDGRQIAFTSLATTLLPAAQRVWPYWIGQSVDGYVWDGATGQTEIVSVNDVGEHSNVAQVIKPFVSGNGRHVGFQNTGLLLKGVTAYQQPTIIVRDRVAGTTEQVSHDRWGTSALGTSVAPALSNDGSKVAFLSTGTDLAAGDTNNLRDVYVLDRNRSGAGGSGSDDSTPDAGNGCPGEPGDGEGYSDLSVEAGEIQASALEQGQSGQVEVTVRNTGAIVSGATTVRLYDGDATRGTLIGEQSLGALAAGASAELSFTWDPVGDAGQHKLTVAADPERLTFEQNLANNEAERSVDVVAPRLELSVDPDKPAYGADESIDFASRVTNGSSTARDARLVLSIRDEDGDEVANVQDGQVHVESNGDAVVHTDWNTLDTTPGRYTVAARILNAVGDELTSAESTFEIKPDVAAGLSLQTDELSYGAGATATIGALVSNRSTNSVLSGAHVQLSLSDPDGDQLEMWNLSAGDVMQGRSALLNQAKSLRDLDPGTYRASAKLLAADGSELDHAAAEFELRSSADTGDGVRGSIVADPADPLRLSIGTFRYSLTNSGNADITGAKVRVRISDLDSGNTLKTLDDARTVGRGAATTGSLSTTADMAENRDYQASLHLVLADGSERPLDRVIIHVRPAPFTFGASFDTSPRNRVLVWACDGDDEAAARMALGDTFATYLPGCGSDEQARFMRLLRSGDYNQFWLLGRHHPLERAVGDELAARVIQGDGLLVAGGDGGSGHFALSGNQSPLGAAPAGTVPPGTYALQFAAGSAFTGLDGQVTGTPAKLTTTQATAIATTSWGPTNNRKTAITATYNQFGQGKAVYVGVAPSAFADRTRAAAVLGTSAAVLLSPADATRAAGLARLDLFVEGTAPGSPLEIRTQLPAGMGVPQQPADATFAAGLLSLPFETAGTQRSVWLKLPTGAASATTSSTVHYRSSDGQTKQYGNPASASLNIVESKQSAKAAALAALGQVGGLGGGDGSKLQKIKDDVNAAGAETSNASVLWSRLRALVDDIGTLERSRWTNTAAARTAVARLIAYVEYDYYRAGGN